MQSHLSEIEAGKRNASVDLIGVMTLALGVPVAALFDGFPDGGGRGRPSRIVGR